MSIEVATTASRKKTRPDEVFRRQARQTHRLELERELTERLREGRYPFEGSWCTLEEIQAKRRDMRRSDRVVLAELIALFLVMLATGLLPVLLLSQLVLP